MLLRPASGGTYGVSVLAPGFMITKCFFWVLPYADPSPLWLMFVQSCQAKALTQPRLEPSLSTDGRLTKKYEKFQLNDIYMCYLLRSGRCCLASREKFLHKETGATPAHTAGITMVMLWIGLINGLTPCAGHATTQHLSDAHFLPSGGLWPDYWRAVSATTDLLGMLCWTHPASGCSPAQVPKRGRSGRPSTPASYTGFSLSQGSVPGGMAGGLRSRSPVRPVW